MTFDEARGIWEAIEDSELNMEDFLDTVSKDFKSALEIPYERESRSTLSL